MILTHELGVPTDGDVRQLGKRIHDLAFAQEAGAQVVIVRVESPRAVAPSRASLSLVKANEPAAYEAWAELLARLRTCPLPSLGVVEGPVISEAVALIAACDVVLAGDEASFAAPRYSPTRGEYDARAWACLERRLSAEALTTWANEGTKKSARWAAAAGLVDGVFDGPAVTSRTARCARALAGAPPSVLRGIRHRAGAEPLSVLRWSLPSAAGDRQSSSPPPELRVVDVLPRDEEDEALGEPFTP